MIQTAVVTESVVFSPVAHAIQAKHHQSSGGDTEAQRKTQQTGNYTININTCCCSRCACLRGKHLSLLFSHSSSTRSLYSKERARRRNGTQSSNSCSRLSYTTYIMTAYRYVYECRYRDNTGREIMLPFCCLSRNMEDLCRHQYCKHFLRASLVHTPEYTAAAAVRSSRSFSSCQFLSYCSVSCRRCTYQDQVPRYARGIQQLYVRYAGMRHWILNS